MRLGKDAQRIMELGKDSTLTRCLDVQQVARIKRVTVVLDYLVQLTKMQLIRAYIS